MKFMVSLITDSSAGEEWTPEQMERMGADMGKFMGELQDAGVLMDPGAPLAPAESARTLRYGEEGKVVVTDGPFAESKEQMAGYMVLDCEDLDEALEWVRKLPVGPRAAGVEVRPIAVKGP